MRKTGGGVILNVSSLKAFMPSGGKGPYGAGKAAVVNLTRSFAAELACHNIRVVCYARAILGQTSRQRPSRALGRPITVRYRCGVPAFRRTWRVQWFFWLRRGQVILRASVFKLTVENAVCRTLPTPMRTVGRLPWIARRRTVPGREVLELCPVYRSVPGPNVWALKKFLDWSILWPCPPLWRSLLTCFTAS